MFERQSRRIIRLLTHVHKTDWSYNKTEYLELGLMDREFGLSLSGRFISFLTNVRETFRTYHKIVNECTFDRPVV